MNNRTYSPIKLDEQTRTAIDRIVDTDHHASIAAQHYTERLSLALTELDPEWVIYTYIYCCKTGAIVGTRYPDQIKTVITANNNKFAHQLLQDSMLGYVHAYWQFAHSTPERLKTLLKYDPAGYVIYTAALIAGEKSLRGIDHDYQWLSDKIAARKIVDAWPVTTLCAVAELSRRVLGLLGPGKYVFPAEPHLYRKKARLHLVERLENPEQYQTVLKKQVSDSLLDTMSRMKVHGTRSRRELVQAAINKTRTDEQNKLIWRQQSSTPKQLQYDQFSEELQEIMAEMCEEIDSITWEQVEQAARPIPKNVRIRPPQVIIQPAKETNAFVLAMKGKKP